MTPSTATATNTANKSAAQQSTKSTISLCLIVKNEEKYLADCLLSVLGLVDEIIIVDTDSKDKTKEIAEEFRKKYFSNLKIFDFSWINDFSSARNFSISYASCGWILFLDADERIEKKDIPKIRELTSFEKFDGFMLVLRNYSNNSHLLGWQVNDGIFVSPKQFSGFYPAHITRLFKNNKGFVFRRKFNESVDESVFEKKGRIKLTDVVIHHLQHLHHEQNASLIKKKQLEYLKTCESELKENDNFKIRFDMGMISMIYRQDLKSAVTHLKKCIDLNPNYLIAYIKLGFALEQLNLYAPALDVYKKALSIEKNNLTLLHNIGVIYFKLGQPYSALDYFEQALNLNPNNPHFYNNMGNMLNKIGRHDDAVPFFKKALDINPDDANANINAKKCLENVDKNKRKIKK